MARIIMYGAYNLCFDPTLGRIGGTGPNFFQFLKNNGYPVNRVKVILFRNSLQEELQPGHSVPLFASGRLNPRFLANLQNLVTQARLARMSVQVCLFSYHSVVGNEQPESPPALLNVAGWQLGPCAKLRRFFSLDDAAVVEAQSRLVTDIVTHLRTTVGLQGIVWEIANELRSDRCRLPDGHWDAERNRQNNCEMVRWLNRMKEVVRAAAAPEAARMTTSTGTHDERVIPKIVGEANEGIVFDKQRRFGGCTNSVAFVPHFFDLHSGQWEPRGIAALQEPERYLAALPDSVAAVRTRLQSYGYANPVVMLNDDGLTDPKRTRFLADYVRAAFKAGFGYGTKQQYPPLPFDRTALDILRRVHREVPVTATALAGTDEEGMELAGAPED
jgi:hypothetical protein